MKLYEYPKEKYGVLLAADILDASKGVLFQNIGLKPETTNRTILIGIGGTGVQTVDYVKGAIQKRLDPTWSKYIAFVGMDTSWTELERAVYLDPAEKFMYTEAGAAQRMSDPQTYPSAVRPFMLYGEKLGALDSDGAGRTRLVGKVKIHDAQPGSNGVDEKIVGKLRNIKQRLAPLDNAGGKYEVYVIGSACGGTCSGGFLEMPSLIRYAFQDNVVINGMLYLPDTLVSSNPNDAPALEANGYATLKELNYYMGMYMRPEYAERWSYNDSASPELELSSKFGFESFFDVPYLIGTTNGASTDAFKIARESIAEFLISLLAKMQTAGEDTPFLTSAFMSNALSSGEVQNRLFADNNRSLDKEAANEFHEFPKRFAAIGFAKAAVPQKLVRAYEVGKLCQAAGLRSVSAAERVQLQANGAQLLPFRHEDDLMNAQDGTKTAWELLASIKDLLKTINSVEFDFAKDAGNEAPKWEDIKNGLYDQQVTANRANKKVTDLTNPASMNKLQTEIQNAFHTFRDAVKEYVKAEGAFAFYNLYEGRFSPVGGNRGVGIKALLDHMVRGEQFNPNTGDFTPFPFLDVTTTVNALQRARSVIDNTDGLGLPPHTWFAGNKRKTQAAQWRSAFENKYKAIVVDKRKVSVLNEQGSLRRCFANPAAILADQIKSFGNLLEELTGIYSNLGKPVNSFEVFQNSSDGKSEVNLAGFNQSAYTWIKQKADQTVAGVNALKIRDGLVDEYFSNIEQWQEIPNTRVTLSALGEPKLTSADFAVPAREAFDQYIAKAYPMQASASMSIENVFDRMNEAGMNFNVAADSIIRRLKAYSRPQYNGDIPDRAIHSYVVYPDSLSKSGGSGPAIRDAIVAAAQNAFQNVGVYASTDTDSIAFYQDAAPLEIYRLADLKNWEKQYESGSKGIQYATYLHGMSPDVKKEISAGAQPSYVEMIPWKDYPSITRQTGDPRKKDPNTGVISREGKLRLELDKEIARARQLGVLYSEKDADGKWIVKRVFCHERIEWKFDLARCSYVGEFLPTGKLFVADVAHQNGEKLENISRQVFLESSGGVMDKAGHPTEELAWEYAARTLRAHVPMYIEIRKTVDKLMPWAKQIEEYNLQLEQRYRPAKMIHMVMAGLLFRREDNAWVLQQAAGTTMIANITSEMLHYIPQDAQYVENDLLAFYLYNKLESVLGDEAFQEEYKRAREMHDRLVQANDLVALEDGLNQARHLLDEIDILKSKGAVLMEKNHPAPTKAFREKFVWMNDDELKALETFYYRLGLWVKL